MKKSLVKWFASFSAIQLKALSAYKKIAFGELNSYNEKSLAKWFAFFRSTGI